MSVCFSDDRERMEFVDELQTDRATAVWRATLSNGRTAVMDDGRPGVKQPSAWLRLRDHCLLHGLYITKLWLTFRSNIMEGILPENADGYFFCHGTEGWRGSKRTTPFCLLGAMVNGKLTIQKWRVPFLLHVETFTRDPEAAPECLIRNRD